MGLAYLSASAVLSVSPWFSSRRTASFILSHARTKSRLYLDKAEANHRSTMRLGTNAREQIAETDEVGNAVVDSMAVFCDAESFLQHRLRIDAGLEGSRGSGYCHALANRVVAAAHDHDALLEQLARQIHVALQQDALRICLRSHTTVRHAATTSSTRKQT